VSSSKPSLLSSKLLAEGPLKALLLSDVQYFKAEAISSFSVSNEEFRVGDSFVAMGLCAPFGMLLLAHHVNQDYVVDGFAQEVYTEVLSTTTSYHPYLSKHMENEFCAYPSSW